MRTCALICLFVVLLGASACSSPREYFLLELRGEGWTLEVKKKSEQTFTARWIEGPNRSIELSNYDDSRGAMITFNKLYLEVDEHGRVKAGRLKRFLAREFSGAAYEKAAETGAQWFAVQGGSCVLDDKGEGRLDVRCEGDYVFSGNVLPSDKLETKNSRDSK